MNRKTLHPEGRRDQGRLEPPAGSAILEVTIQILAWLLVLCAPFGTVILAFMTIVWVNRPGIDGILAVYAGLIGLEALALAFLTSSRRPWALHRLPLLVTFAVTSGVAPFVLFAYAVLAPGTHG